MILWIDDVRKPPEGKFIWAKSVNQAKLAIEAFERLKLCSESEIENLINKLEKSGVNEGKVYFYDDKIEMIDIDHDAGDCAYDGGDYIKLLDWLEETRRNYPIRIHSMNPVGRENMRRIIQKNKWREYI